MALSADDLHLRLIYRRIAKLRSAAVTLAQLQQANAVRNRVTAELVRRGWRVPEVATALGKTYRQVRSWYEQGRASDTSGLSLPHPSPDQHAGLGADRLTVPAVAMRLRVTEATVRRWIKDGYLPATRTSNASHARWAIEAKVLEQLGVPEVTLTVQEMARRYRVHRLTVRLWISQGHVPAVAVHPGGVCCASRRTHHGLSCRTVFVMWELGVEVPAIGPGLSFNRRSNRCYLPPGIRNQTSGYQLRITITRRPPALSQLQHHSLISRP